MSKRLKSQYFEDRAASAELQQMIYEAMPKNIPYRIAIMAVATILERLTAAWVNENAGDVWFYKDGEP